jgi:formate-dependent nitrite reductase membrane component NrfD
MDAVGFPSTFFTAPPHWRWLIVAYFFVGGLAGGCYVLAAMLDMVGTSRDRGLARVGYLVAFPAVLVCGVLLIVDLDRPERFWHMLVQSNTGRLMLKTYSPMSLGAWALLVFGGFSFLAFLAALRESRVVPWGWPERLRPPGLVGILLALGGGLAGLFLAGYTGVLLAVTNRPIWSDTPLLGLTFVVSAASTAAAFLLLLGRRWAPEANLARLARFESLVLVLDLLALFALVLSLGPLIQVWLDAWGALLILGVVGAGIVLPLALRWWPGRGNAAAAATVGAILVLLGGLVFRILIVLSSEQLGRVT